MPLERQQKNKRFQDEMHGPHKMKCVVRTTTFSKDVGKCGKIFLHKPTGRKPRGKKVSYEKYGKGQILDGTMRK